MQRVTYDVTRYLLVLVEQRATDDLYACRDRHIDGPKLTGWTSLEWATLLPIKLFRHPGHLAVYPWVSGVYDLEGKFKS